MMNCAREPVSGGRFAGTRRAGLCVVLLTALAAGCAHSPKNEVGPGGIAGMAATRPPAFLSGPMALLLTNVDGFRAHVVLEGGGAPGESATGELLGRGGKLVFAPGLAANRNKRAHAENSAFIWDVAGNRGFLLNGPLQGYAPISASRQFTNLVTTAAPSGTALEKVAGHRCLPVEVTVAASDGSATVLHLWRATDLNGLPVRITGAWNGTPLVLTLSKARLEAAPEDLFAPPGDFTKYPSAEAMMAELTMRQHNLSRRPTYSPSESLEPGTTVVQPPVRQ
jgi:hypothetical protein